MAAINSSAELLAVATILLASAAVLYGFPAVMTVERAFPTNHGVELTRLRNRDRSRHSRMLQSFPGIIDFSLAGNYHPLIVGLYYTKVQLGTPPRDFYVQIDTGSDVLWIACSSCNGCPETTDLELQLSFYDPKSSSTASLVSCSDQMCSLGVQSSDSICSPQNNQCAYGFQYGDGSGSSGYYVADLMHFDVIVGSSLTSNSSASVVFGCSISQTGDLTKQDRAVDGIFGFGQQEMSISSQLYSQGIAPRVFSHCLKGDNSGGGILVLGEIVEPNIIYTPLLPARTHYNLRMLSISVNGQVLSIDPTVFSISNDQGTIVDSGTTLAYLPEEAYDPLVTAIANIVGPSARSVVSRGNQCYLSTSSVSDIFPQVSLNFAGGAVIVLRPQDYLVQQNSVGGLSVWCIGFQKAPGQRITILGDLVLKDKIFVYDLASRRIGWTNYDCSMAVNISANPNTGRNEYVFHDSSSSMPNLPYTLLLPSLVYSMLCLYL